MEQNSMQAQLLDLIQRANQDERAFVSALSDAERAFVGSPKDWSAKDLIAHVAAWKQCIAVMLAAAARGEVPPSFADEDALNAETFEANRHRTWEEVLGNAERAVVELSERVKELSEEALTQPNYFSWRQGRALHEPIASNGFGHSQSHLAEWYLKHGELARANEIQERLAEVRRGLDDSPRNRAIASYNLACFYALTAQSDKALALLADAFQLSPDLIEWSKQDKDLDSLRDNHTFQSLVEMRA